MLNKSPCILLHLRILLGDTISGSLLLLLLSTITLKQCNSQTCECEQVNNPRHHIPVLIIGWPIFISKICFCARAVCEVSAIRLEVPHTLVEVEDASEGNHTDCFSGEHVCGWQVWGRWRPEVGHTDWRTDTHIVHTLPIQ